MFTMIWIGLETETITCIGVHIVYLFQQRYLVGVFEAKNHGKIFNEALEHSIIQLLILLKSLDGSCGGASKEREGVHAPIIFLKNSVSLSLILYTHIYIVIGKFTLCAPSQKSVCIRYRMDHLCCKRNSLFRSTSTYSYHLLRQDRCNWTMYQSCMCFHGRINHVGLDYHLFVNKFRMSLFVSSCVLYWLACLCLKQLLTKLCLLTNKRIAIMLFLVEILTVTCFKTLLTMLMEFIQSWHLGSDW